MKPTDKNNYRPGDIKLAQFLKHPIGFIGGGRITRILLQGFKNRNADIVFIALHPPVVIDMLEAVKADIRADAVVISLAPKIITVKLEHVRNIARLIPNATSYINEGFNPVTFAPEFDHSVKKNVTELPGKLGATFKVSEEKLGSYAIMSAMGSWQLAVGN